MTSRASAAPPDPAISVRTLRPWTRSDTAILLALVLFTGLFSARRVHWHVQPFEDSLMLLRYAQHVAHGDGIVWNVGDRPVEGATDFLFLMVIAGVMKLTGAGAILTCRLVALAGQTGCVALLFYGTRQLFSAGRLLAGALALYLAVGPGVDHISNGFSPTFLSFWALAAWFFVCRAVVREPSTRDGLAFGLFALLTGLTRPDGVLLAVFMALGMLAVLGRPSLKMLAVASLVFAGLGGCYFVWRFHYFGYLLPNPFYKKGGGHLYPDSLQISWGLVLRMILPVTPVIGLAMLTPALWRRLLLLLFPLLGFTSIWILLTTENDVEGRFQYVVLPVTLFVIPYLVGGLREVYQPRWCWPELGRRLPGVQGWMGWALGASALAASFLYWKGCFPPIAQDGSSMRRIALQLRPLQERGYTMAVTEAGTLPYFSEWRAIDTWGLNDAHITHDPSGLTEAYLQANDPAILMYFASPFMNSVAEFGHMWTGDGGTVTGPARYNGQLAHFAATHNYQLVARWGPTACAVHIWYVRRDLPEFARIQSIILEQPHFFLNGGGVSINHLEPEPPTVCGDPGARLGWKE